MKLSQIERDLKLIRQMMESSSRYTNIPASGYAVAGLFGLFGAWRTALFIQRHHLTDRASLPTSDMLPLAGLWLAIFVITAFVVGALSWRKARLHGVSAWNSLAARMFLSQIPAVVVAGMLTVALGMHGASGMIPALWLSQYGVILYSFSYFTGVEHKIESLAFLAFGAIAAFAPLNWQPSLLGLGFGGVHLLSGVMRQMRKQKERRHESD